MAHPMRPVLKDHGIILYSDILGGDPSHSGSTIPTTSLANPIQLPFPADKRVYFCDKLCTERSDKALSQMRLRLKQDLIPQYSATVDEMQFQQRYIHSCVNPFLISDETRAELREELDEYSARPNPEDQVIKDLTEEKGYFVMEQTNIRSLVGAERWDQEPAVNGPEGIRNIEAATKRKKLASSQTDVTGPVGPSPATQSRAATPLTTLAEGVSETTHVKRERPTDESYDELHYLGATPSKKTKSRTSKGSQVQGGTSPDIVEYYRSADGRIYIRLIIELKWVKPRDRSMQGIDAVVTFKVTRDGHITDLPEAAYQFAVREAAFQAIWYLHMSGKLCGTRIAIVQVNEYFFRIMRLDGDTFAFELAEDVAVSNFGTMSTESGTAPATETDETSVTRRSGIEQSRPATSLAAPEEAEPSVAAAHASRTSTPDLLPGRVTAPPRPLIRLSHLVVKCDSHLQFLPHTLCRYDESDARVPNDEGLRLFAETIYSGIFLCGTVDTTTAPEDPYDVPATVTLLHPPPRTQAVQRLAVDDEGAAQAHVARIAAATAKGAALKTFQAALDKAKAASMAELPTEVTTDDRPGPDGGPEDDTHGGGSGRGGTDRQDRRQEDKDTDGASGQRGGGSRDNGGDSDRTNPGGEQGGSGADQGGHDRQAKSGHQTETSKGFGVRGSGHTDDIFSNENDFDQHDNHDNEDTTHDGNGNDDDGIEDEVACPPLQRLQELEALGQAPRFLLVHPGEFNQLLSTMMHDVYENLRLAHCNMMDQTEGKTASERHRMSHQQAIPPDLQFYHDMISTPVTGTSHTFSLGIDTPPDGSPEKIVRPTRGSSIKIPPTTFNTNVDDNAEYAS